MLKSYRVLGAFGFQSPSYGLDEPQIESQGFTLTFLKLFNHKHGL